LTNWFGNSASSVLSKTAALFTVPVVVSIWLSSVSRVPLAIFFCPVRSRASTASLAPGGARLNRSEAVLGYGEDDGDGLELRDDRQGRPLPVAWTTLPGSASLSPTRPEIGAVMWQKSTCTWSYCTVPWSILTVPCPAARSSPGRRASAWRWRCVPKRRGTARGPSAPGRAVLVALERALRLEEGGAVRAANRCQSADRPFTRWPSS
jgi:hypothetical protein